MVSAKTERLGAYAIERRIAVGGMAEVFEASAAGREGSLVIKVLLPQLARDDATRSAFEHEGRVGRLLQHEGIARVVDSGAAVRDGADAPYLVIERVRGVLLADLLASREPLSFAAVASLLIDLLGALAFAHDAKDEEGRLLGLVHRDVTPRNVFATVEGRAVLAVFGIARSSLRADRTRTGALRGTLGYLSPEQVTGSDVDRRSDVFAAAVLAWELATAEPYVAAMAEIDRLRASEDPPFRKPSGFGADARLDAILERALRRFPEERHPTAGAFRDAVAAVTTPAEREAGRLEVARRVAALEPTGELPPKSEPRSGAADRFTGPHDVAPSVVGDAAPAPAPALRSTRRTARLGLIAGLMALVGWGLVSWRLRREPSVDASEGPVVASQTPPIPSTPPSTSTAPTASSPEPTPSSEAAAPVAASSTAVVEPPKASRSPSPSRSPLSSAAPASTASTPEAPSSSAPAPTPPAPSAPLPRRDLRAELDATNALLREARRRGQDTRAADARTAVALEALLDGRDADAERELAAIRALLAQ